MSFGLPSLKVKPEQSVNGIKIKEGSFGVPDPMVAGLGSTKTKLAVSHPLEISERNVNNKRRNFHLYHANEEKMNLTMLRNIQGLHAPMKITMERKFASKVGHLPFLPSSNFQNEILTGRHIEIGFEDILNTGDLCEVAGHPHAVVERSLGLL